MGVGGLPGEAGEDPDVVEQEQIVLFQPGPEGRLGQTAVGDAPDGRMGELPLHEGTAETVKFGGKRHAPFLPAASDVSPGGLKVRTSPRLVEDRMPAGPLQPGDPPVLGAFELLGRLGEGGQGIVYEARSPAGERVAVKLLRSGADPATRRRLARELESAQRVAPLLHRPGAARRARPARALRGERVHRRAIAAGPGA